MVWLRKYKFTGDKREQNTTDFCAHVRSMSEPWAKDLRMQQKIVTALVRRDDCECIPNHVLSALDIIARKYCGEKFKDF